MTHDPPQRALNVTLGYRFHGPAPTPIPVAGTLQDLHLCVWEGSYVLIEQFHSGKGVPGPLEKQKWDDDIAEMSHTQLLGFAGGMKRVRIQDHSRGNVSLRDHVRGDSPAHRTSRQKELVDLAAQIVGSNPMTLEQSLGPVRTLRTAFRVRIVERHHLVSCCQPISQRRYGGMILVCPCSMGEENANTSIPGKSARHFAATP